MPNKQFNSVDGYSVGNANIVIDSNGNVSGNLITATANVTAPRFISNVSTGTAPFVVNSTTQVANLNVATAGTAGTATTAGTVTTAAQPNITSVGTLTSLSVSGNANAGNVGATNFVGSGASLTNLNASNISSGTLAQARLANASVTLGSTALTLGSTVTTVAGLSSVTSTTFVGSLSGAATTAGTVTTAAQPNITSVGTLTSLTVSGNANAGNVGATNFVGSGASLTNLNASNLASGTVPSARLSGSYSISVTGSAGTAGTVTTAAQPNITSVGTLTGLGVNGTVTAVNFTANTGVFTGNGSGLSAIAGANVTGTVSSATTATTAGTVTTAAQPNITSTGTLTSLTVSGAANVTGGVLRSNNLLLQGDGTDGYVRSTNSGSRLFIGANGTNYVTIAASGAVTSVGGITAPSFTANTGVFTGNGAALTNLNASNLASGTVPSARLSGTYTITVSGSATTAGTVTTAAQPNITSVGTLTSLSVSGAISARATGSEGGQLDLNNPGDASIGATLDVSSSDVTRWFTIRNNSLHQIGQLQGTGGTVAFYTAGAERMRVDPLGRVGIGTASPAANLDIIGNTRIQSNIAYVSPNGANTINSTMLNGGTLAWSGNAGQLFSITDSMTGNIFTVNDVSGIPMISVDAGGNIQFAASGGFVNYGVTTGISAAGSTQGTATALTRPINVVSTVSANTGVILPTVPAGARVIVMNTSATALRVYPPSGAAINSAAVNAFYSMPAGTRLEYISVSSTQWYTMNATYG